jgi:hypothetical protein
MDASSKNPAESVTNLQAIREHLFTKFADIFGGVPPELPPLREINH